MSESFGIPEILPDGNKGPMAGPLCQGSLRPHVTEWGPISGSTAERLGFPSKVCSVLIRPVEPEVARAAEAVLALVPPDVLPVKGDTSESLVARLEHSDWPGWMAWMEVKLGGKGKDGHHVPLNGIHYPQPRRNHGRSW